MKPSFEKYIPFKQINLPDRQWPNNTITKAPIWCSVDLRDGNQALVDPMNLEEKLEFFHALCDMGFKEIEIGFPSASETEYEICRENDVLRTFPQRRNLKTKNVEPIEKVNAE